MRHTHLGLCFLFALQCASSAACANREPAVPVVTELVIPSASANPVGAAQPQSTPTPEEKAAARTAAEDQATLGAIPSGPTGSILGDSDTGGASGGNGGSGIRPLAVSGGIGLVGPRLAAGSSSPSIRQGAVSVSGRLPAEVIMRIVRQNFGRFRLCYENGLRTNAALAGRVEIKFVIAKDGSSSRYSIASTTLSDAATVTCIQRAFSNLAFPSPESGEVVVTYPINFAPAAPATPPAPATTTP